MKLFNAYHKGITMSTINEQPIFVGSLNDAGILNSLKKIGITQPKALSELFANSIDAGCSEILYNALQDSIKITDDGKGMNMEAIQSMFDINKENHKHDKSLGVAGVGGKAASLILSNDTSVTLYTKSTNGKYHKAEIPWGEMLKQNKYTDMISITDMTQDDIVEFHKERETMKNKYTGVTLKFKYMDNLKHEIEKQFCGPEEYRKKYNSELNPEDQLGVIYNTFHVISSYQHYEEKEPRKMQKYNYFGGEDNEFYKGKTEATISVYEKEKKLKRYILNKNNEQFEIKPHGETKHKKEMEKMIDNLIGWNHLGDFEVKVGCRRDDSYFNDKSKEFPISGAAEVHLKYEQDYFGDCKDVKDGKLRDYFCKPQLIRNGQIICPFDLPDENIGTRRANSQSMFTIKHVKSQLIYNPVSCQNNPLDLLCGIQSNKGQCSCPFEKSFTRLIYGIKNEKANEIWNYFGEIVKKNIENENEAEKKKREIEEEIKRKEKEAEDMIKKEKTAATEKKRQEREEKKKMEKIELEMKAQEKKKAREETERLAKEEADRKAEEEALKNATPEARAVKEEAYRKAKEEADRKAKEEADRKAKEKKEMSEHNEIILGLVEILGKTNGEKLGSQMNKVKNPEKYLERKNAINIIRELLSE